MSHLNRQDAYCTVRMRNPINRILNLCTPSWLHGRIPAIEHFPALRLVENGVKLERRKAAWSPSLLLSALVELNFRHL